MSYVLDALEKSEQERLVGDIPSASDLARVPVRSTPRIGGWLVLVIVVVCLLVGGWYIGTGDGGSKPVVAIQSAGFVPDRPVATVVNEVQTPVTVAPPPAPASNLTSVHPLSSHADAAPFSYQMQFVGKVAGIIDSCTVEVKNPEGALRRVQMASIACLPTDALGSREARLFTAHSIFVQEVRIGVLREDANQLVGDVFDRNGRLLNQSLVQQGLATAADGRFLADEQEARTAHRGVWKVPGGVP